MDENIYLTIMELRKLIREVDAIDITETSDGNLLSIEIAKILGYIYSINILKDEYLRRLNEFLQYKNTDEYTNLKQQYENALLQNFQRYAKYFDIDTKFIKSSLFENCAIDFIYTVFISFISQTFNKETLDFVFPTPPRLEYTKNLLAFYQRLLYTAEHYLDEQVALTPTDENLGFSNISRYFTSEIDYLSFECLYTQYLDFYLLVEYNSHEVSIAKEYNYNLRYLILLVCKSVLSQLINYLTDKQKEGMTKMFVKTSSRVPKGFKKDHIVFMKLYKDTPEATFDKIAPKLNLSVSTLKQMSKTIREHPEISCRNFAEAIQKFENNFYKL